MSYQGCGDGGCVFGHPGGMHTNGGCHCLDDVKGGMPRVQLRERIRIVARERKEMLDLLRQFASEWDSFVRRNPELHEGDGLVQEDPFALKVRALLARIDED